MNKKVYIMFALILIFAMLAMPVSAAKPVPTIDPRVVDTVSASVTPALHKVADLMAGQDLDVGDVFITHCGNDVYEVRFEVQAADWFLTEVHFEGISAGDENYILNKGTLIPGKFTVKETFELTAEETSYAFRYEAGADVDDFAAHAVVGQHAVTHDEIHAQVIFSDSVTQYVSGSELVPSVHTWVHSAWDDPADNAALMAEGAIWIWESYYAENPREGDNVEFIREFSVVGTPTAATLSITTDNGYLFNLNGAVDVGDFGPTADWRTVEVYDVLADVLEGQNFLNILAENWAWGTDSPTANPGGVLYKLELESVETIIDIPEMYESAWGAGIDAGTNNWAMLIPVEDVPVFVESLIVLADAPTTTGSIVTYSSEPLVDGATYSLVAYGVADAQAGRPIYFDAKYSLTTQISGDTWTDEVSGYTQYGSTLLDLFVNGASPDWGEFSEDHVYDILVPGDGNLLELHIYDIYHINNEGFITVDVYLMP